MSGHFGMEVKRRIENAALLGNYLDTARQEFGALPPAPGIMQERRKPGTLADYQARRMGMRQNIAGLETQYADAVGNPTNSLVSPGMVPALQSPLIDRPETQMPAVGVHMGGITAAAPRPFAPPMATSAYPAVATAPDSELAFRRELAAGVAALPDVLPQPGTGMVTNNQTGEVIYRRTTPAPEGYGTTERPRASADAVGGLIGGMLEMGANTGDRKRATRAAIEDAKLRQDAALKGPGMMGDQLALSMALEVAKRGGDPREVMATLKGHQSPGAQVPLGIQPMTVDPKNPVANVFNPATGMVQQTQIKPAHQTATRADFAADIKRLGSRERVLQEYARRNITPPKE